MGYPIAPGRSTRKDPAAARSTSPGAPGKVAPMVSIFTVPEAYADPETWHAVAARLRRENPVCRVEAPGYAPFYAVTKHADVIEIERQPERFLNTSRAVPAPLAPAH